MENVIVNQTQCLDFISSLQVQKTDVVIKNSIQNIFNKISPHAISNQRRHNNRRSQYNFLTIFWLYMRIHIKIFVSILLSKPLTFIMEIWFVN